MNIAEEVLEKAKLSGVMICVAESCTGGMVAAALTDIPGSSAVLERGFVTYTNAAKVEMLGVTPQALDAHGAVSEQVAAQMAQGALRASHAQLAVSITGIAGPGGSEHKPEGRVCFGVALGATLRSETVEFGSRGRAQVRAAARDHALKLLLAAL
ncbi:Nicotinamide-nucleotide amidohydrolase PncC [Roseobacter fucihabitans]|uniref:Nicotinamide-nucleotide amidohydrolase PncC n=1 Tax=Roseobacter fucihabitans TaxID=1537242 RepID=A0ABZ2BUU1_9RHOB|nr:CinA family protein [Roseobacter litoralis]MBC6967747.1 Nicotinamide-nucleotide amidohydrolase PncC [Roseobacter litoralis]